MVLANVVAVAALLVGLHAREDLPLYLPLFLQIVKALLLVNHFLAQLIGIVRGHDLLLESRVWQPDPGVSGRQATRWDLLLRAVLALLLIHGHAWLELVTREDRWLNVFALY